MLLVSGCDTTVVSTYKHGPTHAAQERVMSADFSDMDDFSVGSVVIIPDFRTLTSAFSKPSSQLTFFSPQTSSIFVEKVVVYSASKTYEKEFEVHKTLAVEDKAYNGNNYSLALPLCDSSSCDLNQIWSEGDILLQVFARESQEDPPAEAMEFRITLHSSREIVWPT